MSKKDRTRLQAVILRHFGPVKMTMKNVSSKNNLALVVIFTEFYVILF